MIYILIFIIIILILERIINKKPKEEKQINTKNIDYSSLYSKKEYIMTSEELKFYKLLKSITNKYNLIIFTQVSLYAIIKSNNIKDFNKIKSKSIDYVITDNNGKIKFCIELDDESHLKENRQERDKFINELLKQIRIKLIRIPKQNFYNLQELEEKIKESI